MAGLSYAKSDMPLGGLNGESLGDLVGIFSEGNLVSGGQQPMVSLSHSLLEGMNQDPFNLGFKSKIDLSIILEKCLVWAGMSGTSSLLNR